MTFKDFAGAVVKHSVKTAKEIGKTVAVTALAEILDVPITTGQKSAAPSRGEHVYRMDSYRVDLCPKSTTELAIDTVLNAALKMDFDSDRERMAKKILKIGSDGNADIRAYAIAAINKIGAKMTFDSGRRKLVDMVTDLADPNYIYKEM